MTAVVNGLRPVIPVNCPPGLARLMRACWDTNPDLRPSFPEINLLLKDAYLLSVIDEDDYSYSDPPPPAPSSSSSPGQRRSSRDDMLFAPGSQRNMNYGTYYAPQPPPNQNDEDEDTGDEDGETDTLLRREADIDEDDNTVAAVDHTRR